MIQGKTTNSRVSSSLNANRKRSKSSGSKVSFGQLNQNEPHLLIAADARRGAFCTTKKKHYWSIYHCSRRNRAFSMNSKRNCFYQYHTLRDIDWMKELFRLCDRLFARSFHSVVNERIRFQPPNLFQFFSAKFRSISLNWRSKILKELRIHAVLCM